MIVILRAWRRDFHQIGPVLGRGAQASWTNRTDLSRAYTPAKESGLELLIRSQPGHVYDAIGSTWSVVAITSRARHRTGDKTAVVAPVESETWPILSGLILQVSGLIKILVVVDTKAAAR